MKRGPRKDGTWLLDVAKTVAMRLKLESGGTSIRIRLPVRASTTMTDGWSAVIGDLGQGKPRLEIWFDRFSGYSERKLYAGLFTENRDLLLTITNQVGKKLWPVRTITAADIEDGKYLRLADRLAWSEFNVPLLEKHKSDHTYYGIYDQTRKTAHRVNPYFCTRAAAFFEDVARALPGAKTRNEPREVYPKFENRKKVASHLLRERSGLLADECKFRDDYECQVCGLLFKDVYGKLGSEFAEAHHIIPLGLLRDKVLTRLEDLTTVCANCHRMLHRMEGKAEDISNLKRIVSRRRKRQ